MKSYDEIINDIKTENETFYINPYRKSIRPGNDIKGLKFFEMQAAQNRFLRFAPFFEKAFPETAARKGIIESDLIYIPEMTKALLGDSFTDLYGQVLLKCDHDLPIAGSVKARGGIHEVIKIAEELAIKNKLLKNTEDYSIIDSERFREFYSKYTIQVGSTGNLGLSIGLTARKLGFNAIVHMSKDAKEWKKKLLREAGATVIEYNDNYSEAVKMGRIESDKDENSYFIDDENSRALFFGYSSVAFRLKVQLFIKKRTVDSEHPLFVYLPCGVGGAPGGIAFGLKELYGKNVHIFFVEPTKAPCMLLGMVTGLHNETSIYDYGLSGNTVLDGLAVGRASGFVGDIMEPVLSGEFTVSDENALLYMRRIYETEGIKIEPSAAAGFAGVRSFGKNESLMEYVANNGLSDYMRNATHIVWSTGGSKMPEVEFLRLLNISF